MHRNRDGLYKSTKRIRQGWKMNIRRRFVRHFIALAARMAAGIRAARIILFGDRMSIRMGFSYMSGRCISGKNRGTAGKGAVAGRIPLSGCGSLKPEKICVVQGVDNDGTAVCGRSRTEDSLCLVAGFDNSFYSESGAMVWLLDREFEIAQGEGGTVMRSIREGGFCQEY